MNKTKFFTTILCLAAIFFGCSEEAPVQVVSTDGLYRAPAVANVELVFDYSAAGGKTITDNNGNDAVVGVKVVKDDQPSIVLLSDSWLGGKSSDMVKGVNFEPGWTLKVTVVVYKDVGSTIAALIQSLTDFPNGLSDAWVETKDSLLITLE